MSDHYEELPLKAVVSMIYEDEIESLNAFKKVVRFICSDSIELSYEKAVLQRDDWKKRCEHALEEYHSAGGRYSVTRND
jgi:hypothetical protein